MPDFKQLSKILESQTEEAKKAVATWQGEHGDPDIEIQIKVDDFTNVVYGMWRLEGPTNPEHTTLKEPFVMVVEKLPAGYFPANARYYPQSMVEAMIFALKGKELLEQKGTKSKIAKQ